MKTYEDFLAFLNEHLKSMTDFVAATDKDFHPICFATGRFLLQEPYRWEKLMDQWLEAPQVETPDDNQCLEFYQLNKRLANSFRKELKGDDLDTLHKAYRLFYPILVLKSEFVSSIFREDILAHRYKKVFRESKAKVDRIKAFITEKKEDKAFLELMRKFTKDLEGFSLTLINNKKLLDQAIKKIEEG